MFDKTTILQIKAAGGDLHFHFIQFAEKPHQTSCHLHHSAPPNSPKTHNYQTRTSKHIALQNPKK